MSVIKDALVNMKVVFNFLFIASNSYSLVCACTCSDHVEILTIEFQSKLLNLVSKLP